ncbi:amino acid permease 3-like [Setaria viridis]|uniref:amino acid permease 3-like n=1 Tax=Setaria viridis TaxID=4556 RepID=UPI003B3B7C46
MWTASAHIITAVIGSGVLSLGWAIAQLGWVAGPAFMLLFSLVTYYTSALLADCNRSGEPSTVRARSPVFVEKWAARWWPESAYVTGEVEVPLPLPLLQGTRRCRVNPFRATWRTAFVVATTVASMLLPFFNGAVGFLGALGFWPLTVYFPVEMYVVQKKVPRWSTRWVCLQMLSLGCLVISVAAATGSIAGIASDLKVYRPFKSY